METHLLPKPGSRERAPDGLHAVVAGGGLAGLAAACVLAERGVRVTVIEKESYLGGRAGAWTEQLESGESFEMERGFHAFFRQYYNLRKLLQRIDPELSMLSPLEDYPILGPGGRTETFSGLPLKAPWNVIALTKRTPTMGLRDLIKVNGLAALEMLRYDDARCYERFDDMTAREYLDSLRFPPDAKRMLFDVFSHSFFNPEEEMSAGELLMMFHFYFVGNPEGLIFDVVKQPFSRSVFEPLARYLEERGATIKRSCPVESVERLDDGYRIHTGSESLEADFVTLALTVPALQKLLAQSPSLDDPSWRKRTDSLGLTLPFAVWRLWMDGPLEQGRAPFAGTTGVGLLDNISLYHLFEDESRDWAARTGGSVVELHAYGVPLEVTEEELRKDLLAGLHEFYPETRELQTLEERWLMRRDCPAFHRGSDAPRPGVRTPYEGLTLAGDFCKLPMPSALMERAATSGMLAANIMLARHDVKPEPLYSIKRRGMFAPWRKRKAQAELEVHALTHQATGTAPSPIQS
jgi:isorenieratene synthase